MRLKDHLSDSLRAKLFKHPQDNGDLLARCALYKNISISICPDTGASLSPAGQSLLRNSVVLQPSEARLLLQQALNTPGLNIFVFDKDWVRGGVRDNSVVMHVSTPVYFAK